jgi:flavin reductase (DIM6/NTAB) family NADH-FMN oxidoreductase RutF
MTELANTAREDSHFVSIEAVDNFYQASAFIPMSFALVTTVHDSGETGIGPHALVYPFSVTKPYSMLLISRQSSATAHNIHRKGKCALNYVLFDRDNLRGIANMGYPGMPMEEKLKSNPYTFIDSPSPENAGDPDFPKIIQEAFQVFECSWDDWFGLQGKTDASGHAYDGHFNLRVDRILVKEPYANGVDKGEIFPNMPIFCGYRANRGFWFAEHEEPFTIPLPTIQGMEYQSVFYIGNRIDPDIQFTEKACKKLSGIPKPFMKEALTGIVDRAREDGVHEIDASYIDKINAERN